MPFLKHLMHSDQGFECLYFVGKDGLARGEHEMSNAKNLETSFLSTYTFMPAQKDWEDLWSHV